MEQPNAQMTMVRSFSGSILTGLRTTICMLAIGTVILLLAVRKFFS